MPSSRPVDGDLWKGSGLLEELESGTAHPAALSEILASSGINGPSEWRQKRTIRVEEESIGHTHGKSSETYILE